MDPTFAKSGQNSDIYSMHFDKKSELNFCGMALLLFKLATQSELSIVDSLLDAWFRTEKVTLPCNISVLGLLSALE